MKQKVEIRKEILSKLHSQRGEEALRKSRAIKKRLFSLGEFKRAMVVMLYASKVEEVDTDEMIGEVLEMGKRVMLPCCAAQETIIPKEITETKDLRINSYGIREPRESNAKEVSLEEIDLVVVPGVAFDRHNRRLGRGKGYYDRFLRKLPGEILRIGLAFDFQILENLPEDSHDIPVSKVITN